MMNIGCTDSTLLIENMWSRHIGLRAIVGHMNDILPDFLNVPNKQK